MALELTLHPETGELVEVVHSYQTREISELENIVNLNQQVLDDIQKHKETKMAELAAAEEAESEAQATLDDSKSTLERGQQLVAQSLAGLDGGSEGAGSPTEDGVESSPNF